MHVKQHAFYINTHTVKDVYHIHYSGCLWGQGIRMWVRAEGGSINQEGALHDDHMIGV